jgi:hypothetical protein
MLDELLPCANCSGAPHFAFDHDNKTVRLHCIDWGMSTPTLAFGENRKAALSRLVEIWNVRPNRRPTTQGSIEDLINKEVHSVDTPFVLELIARNSEDWETR